MGNTQPGPFCSTCRGPADRRVIVLKGNRETPITTCARCLWMFPPGHFTADCWLVLRHETLAG